MPGLQGWSESERQKEETKSANPAIIMGNVFSLANKTDELTELIKTQREFRESSMLCFTATWLHSHIADHSVAEPGFLTVLTETLQRAVRRKEGGLQRM